MIKSIYWALPYCRFFFETLHALRTRTHSNHQADSTAFPSFTLSFKKLFNLDSTVVQSGDRALARGAQRDEVCGRDGPAADVALAAHVQREARVLARLVAELVARRVELVRLDVVRLQRDCGQHHLDTSVRKRPNR